MNDNILDRGKIKWQPAFFLPLAFEMQPTMFKDQQRQPYSWRFYFCFNREHLFIYNI